MRRALSLALSAAALLLAFAPTAQANDYSFDYYTNSGLRPFHYNTKDKPGSTEQERKCMRRLWLDLDGKTYEVSRVKTLEYRRADGIKITEADKDHPVNDCNIIDVGPVSTFTTGYRTYKDINIDVTTMPEDPSKFITTYEANKDIISREMSANRTRVLSDGVRVVKMKQTTVYVLPKRILFTGNSEPVAIYCSRMAILEKKPGIEADKYEFPRTCTTKYVHPDGLAFGYTFREDKESDYFGMDVLARKRFEEIKIDRNTPAKEDSVKAEDVKAQDPAAKAPAPADGGDTKTQQATP